jgi:hypothetical protein
MSRVKVTMMALFAVVALSAIAAGSASANWFVGGAELKTSAPLATTAKVDEFTKLLVPSLSDLTIECTGATLNGTAPEIVGPGATGKAAALEFKSCATTKPATGCALNEANQTIATLGVNARAFLKSGTEDGVLFSPQTKKTFAEIKFSEANTCALAGLQPVKGAVTIGAPTGQTEETVQAIKGLGSVENNSLEIGAGNKAFLVGGSALLELASGSKWSFK